jgi:hypothetical protein
MTKEFLLHKDKEKMKNANAQNNTFASSNTHADTLACKRVVFLPTLKVDSLSNTESI